MPPGQHSWQPELWSRGALSLRDSEPPAQAPNPSIPTLRADIWQRKTSYSKAGNLERLKASKELLQNDILMSILIGKALTLFCGCFQHKAQDRRVAAILSSQEVLCQVSLVLGCTHGGLLGVRPTRNQMRTQTRFATDAVSSLPSGCQLPGFSNHSLAFELPSGALYRVLGKSDMKTHVVHVPRCPRFSREPEERVCNSKSRC